MKCWYIQQSILASSRRRSCRHAARCCTCTGTRGVRSLEVGPHHWYSSTMINICTGTSTVSAHDEAYNPAKGDCLLYQHCRNTSPRFKLMHPLKALGLLPMSGCSSCHYLQEIDTSTTLSYLQNATTTYKPCNGQSVWQLWLHLVSSLVSLMPQSE